MELKKSQNFSPLIVYPAEAPRASALLMSLFQHKVTIIGCGCLGLSILEAVYYQGHHITATRTEKSASELEVLHKFYTGIRTTTSNREAVKNANVILLCVKPYAISDVCDEIRDSLSGQLVISSAAKKTILEIQEYLGGYAKVARIMTGLFAREEIVYYSLGKNCSSIDEVVVSSLFKKSRRVEEQILAHRTQAACDIGIIALDIEARIKELSALGLEEKDGRILYGGILQAIGKRLEQGFTGEELYNLVTGRSIESFTAKIRKTLEEGGHYDRIRDMVRKTVEALNGIT